MAAIDSFTLISGGSCLYKDLVSIHPPTLGQIRDISMAKYQSYLSILLSDSSDFAEPLGLDEEIFDALPHDSLIFLTLFPPLRNELIAAVSFFIDKTLSYDDEVGYLIDGEAISLEDLREIRKIILQLCCVDDTVTPPKKFRNDKAKRIYELIQARKAEQAKASKGRRKVNPDMELPNLISSFCAFSPSYNLTNVWDLTIYQFYDQYHRLDAKIQLDVYGLRWAAWGKKEFDFSAWHKAPPKK